MFKYLINKELVVFNSPEEREAGLSNAEAKGYSIERVSLDYEEKKEEPKKKEEKDPILENIEANAPEEDFTQGPVESADAASETVAQGDTVLPSEDTSLDSPIIEDDLVNKSVIIGDQSYEAATVVSSIRNGEIKLSGDISSEIYQWSNGENKGIKKGVTNETLLNAYIGKFPNARMEDGFSGGALEEVVLSADVTAGQEGQSIIPDIESYGESLEGTDWDEQKNLFENIFSADPNITIEYDKKGVQQTQSKDRSKSAILTYTNPDTQEKSSVRINENTPGKETAKILSDFGDKYMSYNAAAKITGQASAVLNLAKPGGPLYVSDEAIEAELPGDVTTIFKPKEVSEFQGNRTGGVMVKKTVFPYKDELQAARQIIQKENPDISPEELFDQSTKMAYANIIANKRVELTKKKTEDLIESTRSLTTGIETETQSALLSGLFTKQSKISKDSKVNSVVFCTELDTAEKTANSVRVAQDYLEGKKINQTDIMLSDGSTLKLGVQDGSQMLVSKAGVKITENQLSKIQSENALLNASSTALDKLYERGTELGDKYEKLQPALEAAQLDYNLTEKYATSFGLGVADIGTGLLYATNTLVKYSAPAGIPTVSQTMDIAVDELAIKYKTATNDIRSSFVSDVAVDDAFSSIGNFAKFAMQEVTTQAPVLLAMTASGGTLAPYVVGAWTAGQKGLDITYEDSITGKKTGGVEKTAKMIGYGLANGVFTSLTTNPILQRGIKTYKNAGFGKEFLLNGKDYITQNWKRAVVGDNVLELSGELATNVVENAIDGRPIFENADHVALSSLGFSFAFSTIPFIKGAAARYYSTSDTQLAMDRRMKQIVRLQQNWAMLDVKDPARKDIEKTILELQAVNEATIDKLEKNISTKIDKQGSKGFQGVMNFINGAKQKASDIVNNPNLTPENKREMLAKLEVDFEVNMKARKNFLNEATFGENFYLLEANDRSTYDRLINEAKINTSNNDGTNKAVIDEAIKLYNTERIEENNAAAKKVDKNFQSFKTKDEAIEYIILELGDKVTPENSAAAEKNIMDGGAGVAIPLTDGTVIPIAVVESQLEEGKTSVSIHEVGHPIVSKIFKNNPESMIVFADQIRLWLKQNSPSLDAKMQLNINPYKQANRPEAEIAEETLMAFFEMIGDNKIDLASKENTTFASTLAYNMQEIAGNSYNFNFKGAEDFAAFAASIGTKIKNGDLSFSEIQRLSATVPKVQRRKPTKKQEPKTKASMSIDALEEAYFDLQDQAAEDPDNLALYERMEKAGDALDAALAAPTPEAVTTTEAVQDAPKEVIVRPKADKSKRKYSLDKDVKKEIEPKIAEAQKVNKDLIAQEKKLNADAIAEIEAIDDKVESRTSREKRIADLKNKPLTVEKPPALNKIEREITAALETPINKAVNLFTKLYYDKIAKNATAAVTREEFMQSAKAEITSLTINEFKPETINRSGEEVINDIEDIIFQRGGLRLRNLAQRLGVVGKDQGISRGADALTKIADTYTEMSSDAAIESITEQSLRKVSALLASDTRTEQAKQQVKEFWIENEGNTKVENFKKLPNLINNILSEMFGVTQGTLTARSGNLNKQDYANAVEAFTKQQAVFTIKEGDTTREARVSLDEVGAFQDGLNEQRTSNPDFSYKREANESIAEALFRFLPQTSAGDYKYASGRKGRFSGKSTGLPKNLMNLAYKVESRKTTGIGNVERTEQKLTMEEVLEAIGARKNEDGTIVKKSEVSGRDKEGQTLLGLINLFGRMTTNELSRTEGDLDPMTVMDLEMGKNPNMYSRALTKNFFIPGNNELVKGLNEKLETRFGVNWQDREVANLADVVDFIYKDLRKINLNTARAFTYEYVEQLRKSDDVTEGELSETVGRAVGKAYGTAYKNILEKVGMNKIWNSLSKKSLNKLSDEAKVERIESFLKVYARTFTNEKFLGMTNNADLFNELAKATGLGKKGLNKLGFTLSAEPGINPKTKKEQTNIFIQLNEKPIKKVTGTDYIKKQIATGNTNKVNAAGVTLEKDAKDAHDLILSEIDPLIESGDLSGASEKLAIMRLGTNALVRKVSLLGKFIKLSPKDTEFILEHETAAVFIYDAYQQYINDKGTTTAKNKLEKFLKGAYVNVISKELDDALPRVGGVERMNTKEVKKLINKKGTLVIDYAAQRKELATKNSLKLPKNLRIDGLSVEESIKQVENFDKAITLGNSLDQPTKGISVWDFDDTLATTKSNVLYTMPDGTKGKLDASKFAKEGDTFLANGAEFDFSEFSKVMNGDKGPFFNKAVDRNRKFGNKDVYILTARPANSANAIHEFLKGIGLDIPLANITGLASSDPQAKANWVVGKFAEGYNDFYFADDHVGNVAAVGDALSRLDDVRSKVELAKAAKYSKKIRREYSAILLKTRGDLVVGNVLSSPEGQINAVFDWAKTLDIPEKNQAKYKRAALNFIAKSDTNFPMDIEIVDQAMKIVEAKKLDAMSFANPRAIIDEFAGSAKEKRLDPNKEKQFFNKKSLPEGVETFEIMPSPAGQKAVRRMVDTHWGEKTNPWCVTAQEATYTAAEEKQRKENNPRFPIGVIDQVLREVLIENGVTNYEAHPLDKDSDYQDFLGNLKPGWIEVERKDAIRPFNEDDIIMLDADNQKDYDEFLAMYTKMGYRIVEDLTYEGQPEFLFRMHRNDNPETDKVIKTTRVYQLKDPKMTLDEFMKGPAKGGTVFNPEIEPTGPAELSGQSSALWKDYAVNTTDAGYEIAFKDGKLLGLKNLGGLKQQWFDRMDNATKDLALKVPRDGYGKINGASTMMKTDTGRVYSAVTPKAKYSKRLDKEINFLTNELSTKGEALPEQSTNLDAQPKAVKDVINTLDIKSKVQQARVKSSLQLSKRFNEIIEEESGIESFKEYQSVKAAKKGAKKGKFKFFVPPSAEDFLGLLYTTLPKGKKGESAMAFYKEHLLDPYGKAVTGLRTGRITIAKNYRALKKELGIVPRTLKKNFKYEDENGNMKESLFTKEDAIRVYTWDAQGLDIPGLSNVDLPILVNYVNSNPDLKAFADKLLGLNKNTEPKAPTESWPAGTITSDLLNTLNTDGRKQLLEVWQQNVDAIFTSTNLNKLEAAYGKPYVTALKDSLRRMRTGRNSTPTNNGVTDGIVRWLNAAVGNIMFLNRRSAVLQLISFTNFINFEGNNLYQAGKAFANQPQYWKDWVYLMNSDYLVDRRDGLKINVNEADIATTAKENGFQGVLAKILQVGFIPTKMADSAAIATGGASFYRNRVNALIKGGMSKAAAEKQAMQDFVTTAEVSQQSSDPSKISKQQAEPIGRIILAFANTPSQYARIIKRAAQDLKNGRGDAKTHLSRIVYYGVLQNLVFNFLQQAMFSAMFGDDEDESEEDATAKSANNTKKAIKVANSMTDGILRGIGVAGAVVSVAKNLAIKLYERSQKTRNQNLAATIKDEVMKISPPISSKLSKAGKVGNAFEWGKKEIEFDEMSLKHPYVTAATNTVAALTGLPLDRAQGMAIDAVDIASDETETWMKPLIALGWPKWQLMSEEATAKEREEKKERFKELEADKEFEELNPTDQRRSVLKKLSKKEQEEILWNSGVLTRKQIRNLKTEANRVDKIMALRDKKQFEKDMESLSQGGDILPTPKVKRPATKRKDSLK